MKRWYNIAASMVVGILLTSIAEAQPAQVLQFLARHTQRPAAYNVGSAEVVTYDPATKIAIVSDGNGNRLTYVSLANPSAPSVVRDVLLNAYGGYVNSVAVKNGLVAVALEDASNKTNPGKVLFLDMNGGFRSLVAVGAQPDMVAFTPNGQRVIVCNEGEPLDNYAFDPEGSVSIINVTNPASPTVQHVGFVALNGKQDSLRAMGIRIYGPGASVAQDFEPEYATISADGSTAYVTLQENNALAIIDIPSATLRSVVALGFKDFSKGLPRCTNYEWTSRPVLGTTPAGQNIFLGGFSGLWFTGYGSDTNKLRFLTHPDRGPNTEPTVLRGQTRRPFALPNYQAEVVNFELDRVTGQFTILSRTPLWRKDGTTPISGRPNLQAAGQGIAYTDELPVDLFGNDIANDAYGADLEGIIVDAAGTWWLVDEYRPAIYNFNSNGILIERYVPAGTAASVGAAPGTYGAELLPTVYAARRANRGFEAVAIEGDILYAFIQSPLDNPDVANDASSRNSNWCRILAMNVVTKQIVGEYLYPMFEKAFACDKIGDAVSMGGGKFMVIERDDATGLTARKYLFEINLKGATNLTTASITLPPGRTIESLTFAEATTLGIRPVKKAKSVYLPAVGYGNWDKPEGLARINATTFAVLNDNDFGVGGSLLPNPPNGSISVNANAHPTLGLITFDRPNGLDPSDRDNAAGTGAAIKIGNWPVYGMYQPDAISNFTVNGQTFLVTANEGDAREWGSYLEEFRAGAANIVVDPELLAAWPALKTNPQLGRLSVVNNLGDLDGDGDLDELYTLGARSFSIWNTDGNLIWDSGSEFETRTAAFFPANFNAGHTTNAMDDRSDNKGPEPESVTMGVINDSTYCFIGLERIGHTFMYNVSNPTAPKYIDYINPRNFSVTPNVTNVDNGTVGDLGCEVLHFIPATESPNNTDLIISGNEISGTMSIQQVRIPRINGVPVAAVNHCIPDLLQLAVSATGPSLTYQWTKNGTPIPGATAATYSITNTALADSGTYACRVQAAGGMIITTPSTVVRTFERTQLLLEPAALTQVDVGVTVVLNTDATNKAGEKYQWFRAGTALTNTSKFAGVTTKQLTIRNVTFADTSGQYYCVVIGGCSSVRTRNARVYIPVVFVTQQPRDTSVCPGDTVVLRCSATPSGGDAALSYQWKYVGGPNLVEGGRFSGTQSPTLRINGVRPEDNREYVCVATGFPSRVNRFTNNVTVTVAQPPVITRQPLAANGTLADTVCEGTLFQLTVVAEGDALAYQWYRNGTPMTLANTPSYSTKQAGVYRVQVTGRCGLRTESGAVTMSVRRKPEITQQPISSLKVKEGESFTLSVAVAPATAPVTYQWAQEGRNISGANGPTYTVRAATPGDAGRYVCVVTNECGNVVSYVSEVRTYRDDPTSVDNIVENGVSVRIEPNPANAVATLRVTSQVPAVARIIITNVTGAVVFDTHMELQVGENTLPIETATMGPSGVYGVRVEHPSAIIMTRVVVTR